MNKKELIMVCNELANYLNVQDDLSISKVGLLAFLKRIEQIIERSIIDDQMNTPSRRGR